MLMGQVNVNIKVHLKPPLQVVFCDALILAGSSIQTVADLQDWGEQGAGELIADFNSELCGLCTEECPCQETIF